MMTVKELIDILSNYDGDTPVRTPDLNEVMVLYTDTVLHGPAVYIGDDPDSILEQAVCGLCKKTFPLESLFMHADTDILYICNDCLEAHDITEEERLVEAPKPYPIPDPFV